MEEVDGVGGHCCGHEVLEEAMLAEVVLILVEIVLGSLSNYLINVDIHHPSSIAFIKSENTLSVQTSDTLLVSLIYRGSVRLVESHLASCLHKCGLLLHLHQTLLVEVL